MYKRGTCYAGKSSDDRIRKRKFVLGFVPGGSEQDRLARLPQNPSAGSAKKGVALIGLSGTPLLPGYVMNFHETKPRNEDVVLTEQGFDSGRARLVFYQGKECRGVEQIRFTRELFTVAVFAASFQQGFGEVFTSTPAP